MRVPNVLKIATVAVLATGAGLAAGSAVGANVVPPIAGGLSSTPDGPPAPFEIPNYPTNAAGQTYGSVLQAASHEMEPDLISATDSRGRQGYIMKKTLDELTGGNITTLEEAIEWEESRDSRPAQILIPVFESDGITMVGTFKIDNSAEVVEVAE